MNGKDQSHVPMIPVSWIGARSRLVSSAGSMAHSSSNSRNLWPEPRASPDGWSADRKDELEAEFGRLVCEGRLPLAEAQRAIATN